MAIDNPRNRIYDLVEQHLPVYSLGINILGLDVIFGNWDAGGPTSIAAYAIVVVARPAMQGGAVLLGKQTLPEVTIHVIGQVVIGPDGSQQMTGNFWPDEETVKGHVQATCQSIQQQFIQRQGSANGSGPAPNPFTEALKRHQEGKDK